MTTRKHWPVIVVGAGPTGLTLANFLARYGVEVLLIERNADTVQEPRAVSIDDESLRTMQSVGVINELLPNVVLGYGSEYFSPRGRRFLKVKPQTLEYGYPRRNAFRQPVLEALLRRHLSTFSEATAWFGTELCKFSQSPSQVFVTISTNEGALEVSCDYLVACDGSRSTVRQGLDIDLQGSTFNERWLIVDLENTGDQSRDTKVFCHPSRPGLSLPGPHGTRRFEFMLREGENEEQALDPDNVRSLLHSHGETDTAIVRRKVVYTFHARMAERWRDDRIFLAGDAAHLMPPFAGQGMNSGIRDAHNLAWKLAAVVKRELGPGLLETYETERLPHVSAMTELAVRMGHIMMPRTGLGAFGLQSFFRLLALYPPARSYFAEMRFKPKPRFEKGFLSAAGNGTADQGLVGTLLPQALVASANGYQLLDDVLGDGFSLLAPPGTPLRLLQQSADSPASVPGIRRVAVLDKEDASVPLHDVVAARDVRGDVANLMRGRSPGLYLVRPDRYVAAYFQPDQPAAMWKSLKKLCDSTWSGSTAHPTNMGRPSSIHGDQPVPSRQAGPT